MSEKSILNRESSGVYGWDPTWFDLPPDTWGFELEDAIADFQDEWSIPIDGVCGDITFRRLQLMRDQFLDLNLDEPEDAGESIIVDGEHLPIKWDRVLTYDDQGGLRVTKGFSDKPRTGKGCVVHWPVTYTPQQTVSVLNKRGYGTHFEIGPPIGPAGDVTIYQYVDASMQTWHAVGANHMVGIDITSPVYTKQKILSKLEALGHTERPILSGYRVNGWKTPAIVGYHENQLKALYALLGALHVHCGIVLKAPAHTGDPMDIRSLTSKRSIRNGVFHHAEVDVARRGKWDTVGVDLKDAVNAANDFLV